MDVELATVLETQSTLLTATLQTKTKPLLTVKTDVMRERQTLPRDVKDSSFKSTTMVMRFVASMQLEWSKESVFGEDTKVVRSVNDKPSPTSLSHLVIASAQP